MLSVAILKLGFGNISSVYKAFDLILSKKFAENYKLFVISDYSEIVLVDILIMPGVGAFENVMKTMRSQKKLINEIEKHVFSKSKPFIGICVGMQVLMEFGEEHGVHKGLGWIRGRTVLLESDILPHVGWNDVSVNKNSSFADNFKSIDGLDFYFTHSYYTKLDEKEKFKVLTYTKHEDCEFVSSIMFDNVLVSQFHPEKSDKIGKEFLSNFINYYI